jgi:hypothetical protein
MRYAIGPSTLLTERITGVVINRAHLHMPHCDRALKQRHRDICIGDDACGAGERAAPR